MTFSDEFELDDETLESLPDDWKICEAPDCREPRRPPFVQCEEGIYCLTCLRVLVLGEDPSEIPD